jgi:CheY-like chemotaxis protein
MSEPQTGDPTSRPKSFQDILQQNQQFIGHLQALQEEVAGQLADKEKEMGERDLELTGLRHELEAKLKELDELQNAQLQWAMDRQGLLDQHEALKQGHEDLKASHDNVRSELSRVQDEVARAKARDELRRSQLRELEEERIALAQKHDQEQAKFKAELQSASTDLDGLQNAQLQWAMDREGLIKERDAAVVKQARLEQEWQQARASLSEEKAKLNALIAQLQQQLKALQEEIVPLRAARDKWQAERQRLINDVARLEQDAQQKEEHARTDRKLLQGDLDEAKKKAAEVPRLEADVQRLNDERSALLAKVRALEKDWQAREASIAQEKAGWRKQLEAAVSKLQAMQQDYEKVKALHADLAGENTRRTEEWTAREQRLTGEKNQLKVDLERVQGELSEMMRRSNDVQLRRDHESGELEQAWTREKATLKAQLDEARKAAGTVPAQSQAIARYESEKRALQASLDALKVELSKSGKSKEAGTALTQARKDFEAKFRVIYDQSHDLNSPLNAIIGFSDILLDEKTNKTTPEERREFVQHINESGKRLNEHIRELIEFAKQEAGIQERPVQLVPPVGGPVTKAPVILVADNDPAVRERIEPFLSHAGYEVVIAASAQEALKKAVQLQPLAVLIDTQLPPNGGSGLLYDLKRESKTRDIPVVLTSKVNKEALGFDIGQADFLTKPIDRQQLLQMMVKFDLLADGKRGRKTPATVLIVDDDPQNIRLVKAMLKPFNMEVLVADGGKAGLELALKKKPDLMILDLMMPDVDGFEVVSKLREDPNGSEIPILIYTAKNISSEDRERLHGNIQSIIQKGDFGKDRFLEMINNLQSSQAA